MPQAFSDTASSLGLFKKYWTSCLGFGKNKESPPYPWHQSKTLGVPANITLLGIPLYTPEMNPIEYRNSFALWDSRIRYPKRWILHGWLGILLNRKPSQALRAFFLQRGNEPRMRFILLASRFGREAEAPGKPALYQWNERRHIRLRYQETM